MSGFREDQAEPRNGTKELEHIYSVLTIVIIYQLNKNECQLTNKMYCQDLFITGCFGHLQVIQNTYKILVWVIGICFFFLKKGVRFHFYIQHNNS